MKAFIVDKLIYKQTCPICGNVIDLTIDCSIEQYESYYFREKPIQDIFPDLDTVTRETLKSNYCSTCQKAIF